MYIFSSTQKQVKLVRKCYNLKFEFVGRFPVPLTLDVIQSRLENNYYRRFAAMKHDVEVLLENAEIYFGRNKDNSMKMRRLSDWFTRTLSSL